MALQSHCCLSTQAHQTTFRLQGGKGDPGSFWAPCHALATLPWLTLQMTDASETILSLEPCINSVSGLVVCVTLSKSLPWSPFSPEMRGRGWMISKVSSDIPASVVSLFWVICICFAYINSACLQGEGHHPHGAQSPAYLSSSPHPLAQLPRLQLLRGWELSIREGGCPVPHLPCVLTLKQDEYV